MLILFQSSNLNSITNTENIQIDHNMPFIVNVPVDLLANKYFHTEMEHLMVALLEKKIFVFLDSNLLLTYLLNAFVMLKM